MCGDKLTFSPCKPTLVYCLLEEFDYSETVAGVVIVTSYRIDIHDRIGVAISIDSPKTA